MDRSESFYVKSVSEYIEKITAIIKQKKESIFVYRGESVIYETACQPNLFRNGYLKENKNFEKNIFDVMTANKLTNATNYLEKAIDAQHDGFSSRLLDVSYNCLVALYFAVTPYYYNDEDSLDDKDGIVYVFNLDKIFSPSGDNINNIYNSIVERDKDWFIENSIFQKNHKLIDHIQANTRIIAQQGAFILFQGDRAEAIPKFYFEKIIIDKRKKSHIRNELRVLFGIHTGSIYPEATNLVKSITEKSCVVNNQKFNMVSEMNLVLINLKKELEYFCDKILNSLNSNIDIKKIIDLLIQIEEVIYDYKIRINETLDYIIKNENLKIEEPQLTDKFIEEYRNTYNNLIENFSKCVKYNLDSKCIKISEDELKI